MGRDVIKILLCIAIFAGIIICFFNGGKIVNNSVPDVDINDIEISDLQISNSTYYYNKLDDIEKKYYKIIGNGIMNLNSSILLESPKEDNYDNIKNAVTIALNAFLQDHPEVYYVNSGYEIQISNYLAFKTAKLKLNYMGYSQTKINNTNKQIEEKVSSMVASYTSSGMSDYQKALALHDALIKSVEYYPSEDNDSVPEKKHTAQGALLDRSAVCDGITKAYMLLLDEAEIETIMVTGILENTPHAWNVVKMGGDYYHIDITSDKTAIDNTVIHSYFGITTEDIMLTHGIDYKEKLPNCNSRKYNYYLYNNYVITSFDDFSSKLKDIVKKQNTSNILELKIQNISNPASTLMQSLYDINFNNYKTNNVTKLSYTTINDNYIIQK